MRIDYSGLLGLVAENGMHKTDLVDAANITHNVATMISKGEMIPSAAILKLCHYFNCDVSDLLTVIHSEEELRGSAISVFNGLIKKTGRHDIGVYISTPIRTINVFYNGNGKQEPLLNIPIDGLPLQSSRKALSEAMTPIVDAICSMADNKAKK